MALEEDVMPFSLDNTEGYTQAELDTLNAELIERLAAVDPDDTDLRAQVEKSFADEVSRR